MISGIKYFKIKGQWIGAKRKIDALASLPLIIFSIFKRLLLFLVALGPCCCEPAFSSCGKQGLLLLQ